MLVYNSEYVSRATEVTDQISDILQMHLTRVLDQYVLPMIELEYEMEEENGLTMYPIFPDEAKQKDKKALIRSLKDKCASDILEITTVTEMYVLYRAFMALSKRFDKAAKTSGKLPADKEFMTGWTIQDKYERKTAMLCLSDLDTCTIPHIEMPQKTEEYILSSDWTHESISYETPHFLISLLFPSRQLTWLISELAKK